MTGDSALLTPRKPLVPRAAAFTALILAAIAGPCGATFVEDDLSWWTKGAAHWYREGLRHQAKHRAPEAVECFRRASAIDTGHYKALNNMGTLLMRDKRTAEGVEAFEKAYAAEPPPGRKPTAPRAAFNLAFALNRRAVDVAIAGDRHAEAAALWRRAIALAPVHSDPFNNLGPSSFAQITFSDPKNAQHFTR